VRTDMASLWNCNNVHLITVHMGCLEIERCIGICSIKLLNSTQTHAYHRLFCFYSEFFERVVTLPLHRRYFLIQWLSFTLVSLYLSTPSIIIIIVSFVSGFVSQLEGKVFLYPLEIVYISYKSSVTAVLTYLFICSLFYSLGINFVVSLYCILQNLTYHELLKNAECSYLFTLEHPKRSNQKL
jgi:hypothetical protein